MNALTNQNGGRKPVQSKKTEVGEAKVGCLAIYYANVRSLLSRSRRELFSKRLIDQQNTVFCVNETWLNNTVSDSLVNGEGRYQVFRLDRDSIFETKHGGGIMILVPKEIKAALIAEHCEITQYYESLSVKLFLPTGPLGVSVIYRVPGYVANKVLRQKFLERVKKASDVGVRSFVVGDFNFGGISWKNLTGKDVFEREFIEMTVDNGLYQMVKTPTREKNILDLCLTNGIIEGSNCVVTEPFCEGTEVKASDHKSLTISTNAVIGGKRTISRFRNWKRADWQSIAKFLTEIEWERLFEYCVSANDYYEVFCDAVGFLIKHAVPMGRISSKTGVLPYWSRHLHSLCRHEANLSRKIKRLYSINRMTMNLYLARKKMRQRIRKLKRKERTKFESKILSVKNAKQFWALVKRRTSVKPSVPVLYDDSGNEAVTDQEKVNALNDYFASNFRAEDRIVASMNELGCQNVLNDVLFSRELVLTYLNKLKNKTSCGPDEIPAIFLKKMAIFLAEPLSKIFNVSMFSGQVPLKWKDAIVTPVPKGSAAASDVRNYRPISLTSCVCKVMESVIRDRILQHCSTNRLICAQQYGFVPKKSAELQLLSAVNDWTAAAEKKRAVDILYLDFAKAFDTVSHVKLIGKLEQYGIKGTLLKWIADYLYNRRQCVQLGEMRSAFALVLSGVPQGSVLGPLLFCLFVNDLPGVVKNAIIRMYADDVKLYMEIKNEADRKLFQKDINAIFVWSMVNNLRLQSTKCCVLHLFPSWNQNFTYTLGDDQLDSPTEHKDLGVVVDENLDFEAHRKQVVKSANRTAGVIRRCFQLSSVCFRRKMFQSLILPKLLYCSCVWAPQGKQATTSIEKVLRSFSRSVTGIGGLSYRQRLAIMGLNGVTYERVVSDLCMVFRMTNKLCDVDPSEFLMYATGTRLSRNRGHTMKVIKQVFRTALKRNFWSARVVNLWNSLSQETVRANSVKSFRKRLNVETESNKIWQYIYSNYPNIFA